MIEREAHRRRVVGIELIEQAAALQHREARGQPLERGNARRRLLAQETHPAPRRIGLGGARTHHHTRRKHGRGVIVGFVDRHRHEAHRLRLLLAHLPRQAAVGGHGRLARLHQLVALRQIERRDFAFDWFEVRRHFVFQIQIGVPLHRRAHVRLIEARGRGISRMIDQRLDATHDEARMIGERLDEAPLRRRVAVAHRQRFGFRGEVIPRPARFRIFHAGLVKQRLVKGDELKLGGGGHAPRAAFPLELLQRAGDEVVGLERRIGVDEGFQIADQALDRSCS